MLSVPVDIQEAEKILADEGFSRDTMSPRPEPPLPRNRAFVDPLRGVNFVKLSPSVGLLKIRLVGASSGSACCDCDWPRLRVIARANLRADADKNFSCCDMLCTRTENSFFSVRRIIRPDTLRVPAVSKPEGYKPDEFDFSDWDTGLTVKRKGRTIQVWVSDKNLKPL